MLLYYVFLVCLLREVVKSLTFFARFCPSQVPEVIEDSGDALHLLWTATQPYLREGLAGPAAAGISQSVVQLMHAFLTKGGPSAGEALISSGAVAPVVYVSVAVVQFDVILIACLALGFRSYCVLVPGYTSGDPVTWFGTCWFCLFGWKRVIAGFFHW